MGKNPGVFDSEGGIASTLKGLMRNAAIRNFRLAGPRGVERKEKFKIFARRIR